MLKYDLLETRALITIKGEESLEFLQGILTNDILKVAQKKILYTLMLTPQGKFLYDFFIRETEDQLLLDCFKEDRDEIINKLNLYKLGKNIEIKAFDECNILFVPNHNKDLLKKPGVFVDPRFPEIGMRCYIDKNQYAEFINDNKLTLEKHLYEEFLCNRSLPDASIDMIKTRSFPLEYGMEECNAISFDKGCYVGQELVARTKYRGTIRKEIFRITSDKTIIAEKGEDISVGDRKIGSFCSAYKKQGKALIRKDYYEEIAGEGAAFIEAILLSKDNQILHVRIEKVVVYDINTKSSAIVS